MKGYITLGIQKQFVSSLHNAVELCLKQKMLDKNDTSVAEIKIKDKEDAELSVKYFQKAEKGLLNEFFEELSKDEISKFRSIEFNQLKTKYKKLININETEKELFTKSLDLLQELRNNETHFYIDNSFLSEENFCKLHNFMIVFYKSAVENLLVNNNLICKGHWGKKNITINKYWQSVIFEQDKLNNFSYRQAVLENELTNEIKETYMILKNGMFPPEDIKTHAILLSDYIEKYSYEDVFTILTFLKNVNLIDMEETEREIRDGYDNLLYIDKGYYLVFNY